MKLSVVLHYMADAFVKFPIDKHKIALLTDANWGPQDQSLPDPTENEQK